MAAAAKKKKEAKESEMKWCERKWKSDINIVVNIEDINNIDNDNISNVLLSASAMMSGEEIIY